MQTNKLTNGLNVLALIMFFLLLTSASFAQGEQELSVWQLLGLLKYKQVYNEKEKGLISVPDFTSQPYYYGGKANNNTWLLSALWDAKEKPNDNIIQSVCLLLFLRGRRP